MDIGSLLEDIKGLMQIYNNSLKRFIIFCIIIFLFALMFLVLLNIIKFESETNKNIAQLACTSIASTPLLLFKHVNNTIIKRSVLVQLMKRAKLLINMPKQEEFDSIKKYLDDFYHSLIL